jgi:hypothetical protein
MPCGGMGAVSINTTLLILSVCGRRLFPESRVVGGDKSSFGKWPWQVSVDFWFALQTLLRSARTVLQFFLNSKFRD